MAELKTRPTAASVDDYIAGVEGEQKRADCRTLVDLMSRVTDAPPVMWGPSIVGFGTTTYTNTTGTNEWFVVGFSPRKQALTIYGVHDGNAETPDPLLDELGPHTTGKGCLYLKRLSDADPAVLEQLVGNAWTSAAEG